MANINRPTPPFKRSGTTITQRTSADILNSTGDINLVTGKKLTVNSLPWLERADTNNQFIGIEATPSSLVSANSNLCIGINAGKALTTGDGNVFIGLNSGSTATQSSENVFIGILAGANAVQNATGNVFVGYMAGNLSNGGSNVLIGYKAGDSLTTGSNNVFIGYDAGGAVSDKSSCIFIGRDAGLANDGNDNLAIGAYSFAGTGTAVRTVALGKNSGNLITNGNYNTLLGYGTGASLTTGEANLFIGYNAGANETGSNKLYIENSNSATPLIYGEFDNDLLTFNADVTIPDGKVLRFGTGLDGQIYSSSDDLYISNITQDKDIVFSGNDGGVQTTIMSLDVSAGQLSGIQKAVAGVMTNATAGTDYQLPIFEKTGTVITTKVDKDNIRLTGELETNKKIHIKTDDIPVNSSSSSPASLEYGLTIGESADTGLNITTGGNDTGLRTQNIDVKQYLNIFDGDTLGLYDEFLSDTNDFSTANWEFFGDMGVDGTNAKFIFSTGYGLVRQLYTNFDSPVDFMMCEAEIVVDSNTLNDSAKVKILFGNNLFVKLKVGINKFFIRSGMAINTYPFAIEVTDVTSGELVISEMSVKKSLLCEMHLNGYLRLYDAVTYELLEGMVKSDKEWGLIGATANTDYLAPTNIKNASFAIYDNGNSGATKTIDWANGNVQKVTMTDNCNFSFSNPVAGSTYKLYLIQDAGGTNTHTWTGGGLVIKWNKNTEPVWITTGDAVNIAIIDYDGTTYRGDGWNPS